jgi:hypothetical protein
MARLKNDVVVERENKAFELFSTGAKVEDVQAVLKAMGGRMNVARIYEIKRGAESKPPAFPARNRKTSLATPVVEQG